MPYYIIQGVDKANAAHLRRENRDAHLAYWQSHAAALGFGGPLLNEAGEMRGSMLALQAASAEEARQTAENDPYYKAGLFAELSVGGWDWVINAPKQ